MSAFARKRRIGAGPEALRLARPLTQTPKPGAGIMRYELGDYEWAATICFNPSSTAVAIGSSTLQEDQQCCRGVTRYDSLAGNYLALVRLASAGCGCGLMSPRPRPRGISRGLWIMRRIFRNLGDRLIHPQHWRGQLPALLSRTLPLRPDPACLPTWPQQPSQCRCR